MSGGVDQGSCSSFDKCIVAFASLVLSDLLHVRLPVDLGVCREWRGAMSVGGGGTWGQTRLTGDLEDDDGAEDGLDEEEGRDEP